MPGNGEESWEGNPAYLDCSWYQMWILDQEAKDESCEENDTFSILSMDRQLVLAGFQLDRHSQFYIKTRTRAVAFMTDNK